MTENGESPIDPAKLPDNVDWTRKGRDANIAQVSIGKLEEAAKRGVQIEYDGDKSGEGRQVATISKTVVKDMPANGGGIRGFFRRLLGGGN